VFIRAEDIFCETACLIDELLDADEETDAMSLVTGLWSKAVIDISQWSNSVSLSDRYLITSTFFNIIANAFCLHWNHRYSEDFFNALLATVKEKTPKPNNLQEQEQMERQEEELLKTLMPCSTILEDWVNEYIDHPASSLTEEIDKAIRPQMEVIAGKKGKPKADKKPFDPDTYRETFIYNPENMSIEEISIRLKMAFWYMQGTLIDSSTHFDTFEALLTGTPLDVKITWIGGTNQLRELFSQLVTKKKILWKPKVGLNQILSARFKKTDGTSFTAIQIKDGGTSKDTGIIDKVVECLTPQTVSIEELDQQLKRLHTAEQERADMRGTKNGKFQEPLPTGTTVSTTPNKRTRKT